MTGMEDTPSFRVSPQQEQLWLAAPDGPAGRIQAQVGIVGRAEPGSLHAALDKLVERHEILRTTFVRRPGMRVPLQAIHESLPPRWESVDASRDELAARTGEELRRPLDFERGPLVQALLARTGDETHTLVLTLPSVCADATSVHVLLDELAGILAGAEPAGEPLQYADFSEWQHEQLATADEAAGAFWRQAAEAPPVRIPLAGRSESAPALAELELAVDDGLRAAAADVAARYTSTPAAVVLAAWFAFLARATAAADVVVTTLDATGRHPDLSDAVGPVARPLPLRTAVEPELTFAELVDRVGRELAAAEGHRDRLPSTTPPVAPAFLVRPEFDVSAAGLHLSLARIVDSTAPTPLALAYRPGLGLSLVFDRERIAPEHARLLVGQLVRLLRSAVAEPGTTIADLDLLGDDDRELLLADFNATAAEVATDRVHELFERRAAETPQATAVSDGVGSIGYAALDARANQLARRLRGAGVAAGDVVALGTDRSIDMVVGVLGILKAGGAYLPLNQEHPLARLRHQVEESGARVLVAQEGLLDRLPQLDEVVCLDRDLAALELLDAGTLEPVGGLDNPAYVIYTSGSTGTPKGVAVTHGNLANYVDDIVGRLGADRQALAFGMVTAISTDLGNTAFYPALCSGGALVLVKPEVAADPAAFARRLEGSPLDVLKITPSHLSALLRAGDERVLPRRWLVVGGERLGWDLVDRVRALGGCEILNHYGPTETTVGSCTMAVADGPGPYEPASVPIGRPIANTRCYLLDERLQPVPLDTPGRLFIGGAGVARGYVGQPEQTAARFVADPFAEVGARMYDTGDLARRLPDGTLEFLGREDEQVKIRGFRAEPSEVESALRTHAAVVDAAVVPVEDPHGETRLVAYSVLSQTASVDELRRHLADWLPEYMLPSAFVTLDALPLTASGKVDRRALLELGDRDGADDEEYVAPRTAVEEAVAEIWADVLGLDRVSVEADFFSLGGHSLLATQVVAQVRTDFAIELPLHSLFMCPTVARLSTEIVALMSAADQEGTAKLLEQLEGLSDEEADELVGGLGRGGDAA
jgi:amino acid adenylation domain-containing protein